jgi:hypothetical protein
MNRGRTTIFSIIAILLGFLAIELLSRGAFYFFGRWDTWGYPSYIYAYRPYIGYAYQPSEDGRDRYGFTLDSSDDPHRNLTQKDSCNFRVFMLGGSTVLGRFLDNSDDTLPARVERLLNKQSPPGIFYTVINAGKPAYISVQTFLEHALYIKYSLQPDYVVHFDGSNDSVGHPKYWPNERYPGIEDNIHRYNEDIFSKINKITGLGGSLNALLRNLADYSAFMFALHKTINDPGAWGRLVTDKDVLKNENDRLKDNDVGMAEWVEKHVSRYIYNVRLAIRLGDRDTGVAYLLQPTMLLSMEHLLTSRERDFLDSGNYATEFHGYSKRDSKELYYSRVREEFEKLVANNDSEFVLIADLSRLFDQKSPDDAYFGDYVHYLPLGRGIVAREIANIIWPRIQKQIQSDPQFDQCTAGL